MAYPDIKVLLPISLYRSRKFYMIISLLKFCRINLNLNFNARLLHELNANDICTFDTKSKEKYPLLWFYLISNTIISTQMRFTMYAGTMIIFHQVEMCFLS